MYETYQKPIRIILYEKGGSLYHYDSYEEFIEQTKWVKIGDGPDDTYWGSDWSWADRDNSWKHYYNLWAKDEFGNPISKDQIYKDRRKEKGLRYPHTIYRKDPVPGTGNRGGYRWWKHPKTTQEMREYYKISTEEADTGYPVHYRAKRNPSHLPKVWDDKIQSDWGNHSWKEFRKTQYK